MKRLIKKSNEQFNFKDDVWDSIGNAKTVLPTRIEDLGTEEIIKLLKSGYVFSEENMMNLIKFIADYIAYFIEYNLPITDAMVFQAFKKEDGGIIDYETFQKICNNVKMTEEMFKYYIDQRKYIGFRHILKEMGNKLSQPLKQKLYDYLFSVYPDTILSFIKMNTLVSNGIKLTEDQIINNYDWGGESQHNILTLLDEEYLTKKVISKAISVYGEVSVFSYLFDNHPNILSDKEMVKGKRSKLESVFSDKLFIKQRVTRELIDGAVEEFGPEFVFGFLFKLFPRIV